MGRKTTVALIYDFDGTLSPGNMQEFGFMKAIGADKKAFWAETNRLSTESDASGILCYMLQMVREARRNGVRLTRSSFRQFGGDVRLYDGVCEWFEAVNAYGDSLGLRVRHFIISSGLKEMIEGTSIAREFDGVFASSYLYDERGDAFWPAVAVDYTTKTQFLFKINKGIKEVCDTKRINEYIPEQDRAVPFRHIIYFGDGETDIPCMKVVKRHGGHSIAVYRPGDDTGKQTAERLIREDRVNFACPANYRRGNLLFSLVCRILDKIQADNEFERLERLNRMYIEREARRLRGDG